MMVPIVCKSIGRTTAMGLGLVWIFVILHQTGQQPNTTLVLPQHEHMNDKGDSNTTPWQQQTTHGRPSSHNHNNNDNNNTPSIVKTDPLYTCPDAATTTTRYDDDDDANADEPAYYAVANAPLRQHWHDFVQTLRQPNSTYQYDGWGKNFNQVLSGMREWKRARWDDYLAEHYDEARRPNNTHHQQQPLRIYESAGGLGLNLLATTDILLQQRPHANIVIYGNEYRAESVDLAANLHAQGVYADQVQWGTYCAADSRYLDFVPSDSFDVVMTGYITPLQNPLQSSSADWLQYTLDHVCPNATLVDQMQDIQQAWYDAWVTAMIRLAKPHGGHIWIEQVSAPLCDNNDDSDWGGVDRAFWTQRADAWGVTVIAMANDTFMHPGRYHVALRKK